VFQKTDGVEQEIIPAEFFDISERLIFPRPLKSIYNIAAAIGCVSFSVVSVNRSIR